MTSSSPPARAVIYVRISSDPTGRAAGVERQEQDCRHLAEQLGWDVIDVRRDNDTSAYSGKPRPGYKALLEDIRTGHADAVLAWHPDRLYRRLPDLEELAKAVQENGAVIRTVRAGAVDLTTASGLMTAEILASVAKHEVSHTIERVTRAKAAAAAEGRYRGGPRPYGYLADGVTPDSLLCPSCGSTEGFTADRECARCGAAAVNREGSEAWHVEQATKAIIGGASLRSICADWAERGIRTVPRVRKRPDGTKGEPESHLWSPTELRRLLLRARNAGLVEVDSKDPAKRAVIGRAEWAPLVSEEDWRACRAVLENPARRTTAGNGRKWLLSGIARCWCGSHVRASTTGIGGRAKAVDGKTHKLGYRCAAVASHCSRDLRVLDKFVEARALERLSRPDAAELHLKPVKANDGENLEAEAARLRIKLEEIAADYAQDLITRQQMLDATEITRKRLQGVEAKMARRSSSSVLASLPLGDPVRIGEVWEGLHLDRKRSIVDALMTITINKARRGRPAGWRPPKDPGARGTYFDADSIVIDWKPPV